ncbi:MAG: hypothetical protein JNN18_08000 [Rubrivivax sp.]|nr:hypothetical protein [Rubrivivax sp.]
MSVAAIASQFAEVFTRFFASKPEDFFKSGPVFNDYDGPNVDETIAYLRFLQTSYEALISTNELALLGKQALANLLGQLQAMNNTYTQLTTSRDQSSYQNFANHVDNLLFHSRMYGVPLLAAGGAQLEAQRLALSKELSTLTRNNEEVEGLKKDVRTLITPAIAGSLSEAFHQRRDVVYRGRLLWLLACFLLGGAATYATFDFVNTVTAAAQASKPSQPGGEPVFSLWVVIAIRTAVLVPLFAAFGFAFAQYRKERDFEEEYAHKAAVANSLPNYGDLAREPTIRDRIVTAATQVIFSSPSEQARKLETNSAVLGGFKEVVEAMGKALGKK